MNIFANISTRNKVYVINNFINITIDAHFSTFANEINSSSNVVLIRNGNSSISGKNIVDSSKIRENANRGYIAESCGPLFCINKKK